MKFIKIASCLFCPCSFNSLEDMECSALVRRYENNTVITKAFHADKIDKKCPLPDMEK